MYRIENNEDAIKALQRLLYVNPSGVYDKATKDEVIKIQTKYNLLATGIVDYQTFQSITNEYNARKNEVWSSDYLFAPVFPFIESDINDNVERINYALKLVLTEYDYDGIMPKGKYLGTNTVNGVIYLRKIFDMLESPEIDVAFFNRVMLEKRAIERKNDLVYNYQVFGQ